MDFSLLAPFAPTLFWLLPLAFAIGLLKSPWVKGYLGELLVRFFAHWQLDKQTYRRLHNVTLPTPDGTTQIDHVFLSRYDIFAEKVVGSLTVHVRRSGRRSYTRRGPNFKIYSDIVLCLSN